MRIKNTSKTENNLNFGHEAGIALEVCCEGCRLFCHFLSFPDSPRTALSNPVAIRHMWQQEVFPGAV